MTDLPMVGVCSNAKVPGANALNDPVPSLTVLPLDKALSQEWATDAHMVTYLAVNQEVWPRCNKPVLPRFRDIGGDLLTTCLVFDWDTPGHEALTQDGYKEMLALLLKAADDGLELALSWTAFYSTRAGVRLIYVLDQPMPVDEAEPWSRAVVRDFARHGVHLDPLFDWGRLFRLPQVVREGEPTWKTDTFECIVRPEVRFDHKKLVAVSLADVSRQRFHGDVQELDMPMPDPAMAKDLLYQPSERSSNLVMTPWFRKVKQRLKGRECAPCIFDGDEIAPKGHRHTTIFQYAGQAVSLLYRLEGTSPELVFALFVEAGFKIDPSTCDRDPHETIWGAVCYTWARESAVAEAERERDALTEQGKQSVQASVLEGMRSWCNEPGLQGEDDESAIVWMTGRMIACTSTSRYVMGRDGYYDTTPIPTQLVNVRVRELDMEAAMPLVVQDAKTATYREVPPQTLINNHGTVVSAVEGVVGTPGTVITGIGTGHAVLQVRMFGLREDMEPHFDAEVDEWLQALGGDSYQRLCDWIGHALDLTGGPICALSIAGPQGTGKGMLVQGLAECIDTGVYADTKEFGEFQGMLTRTPILFLNEGLPGAKPGTKDVADAFRALVDGSPTVINEKYMPPMTVYSPVRVVIAANNQDVVSMLAGKRDLTPDDQAALALRLFHIDSDDAAQKYLRAKGGYMHTGRPGNRWIRGASGDASDHVLAKHFMWLYKHRCPVPQGNRLLVEGQMDAEIVRRLSTRSGSAPEIVETIIQMIESNEPIIDGRVIVDGKVYVTNAGVVQFHRNNLSAKTRRQLTYGAVGKTLNSLMVPGSSTEPMTLTTDTGEKRRTRWRVLDVTRLLEEAVEYGYRCERLKMLALTGDHLKTPE